MKIMRSDKARNVERKLALRTICNLKRNIKVLQTRIQEQNLKMKKLRGLIKKMKTRASTSNNVPVRPGQQLDVMQPSTSNGNSNTERESVLRYAPPRNNADEYFDVTIILPGRIIPAQNANIPIIIVDYGEVERVGTIVINYDEAELSTYYEYEPVEFLDDAMGRFENPEP